MRIIKLTPKGVEAVASALVAVGFVREERELHRGNCRVSLVEHSPDVKAIYSLLRIPVLDLPKFLTGDIENWHINAFGWTDKFIQVLVDVASYRMDAEAI